MKSSDPIVGIDVGTSRLSASIWHEEMAIPEVIFRARGDRGVLDSTLEALPSILRSALGWAPARAVITVPSAMDSSRRIALPGLLETAGLRVERVLSTSTAAALAAGLLHRLSGRVAVIDLGAHSLDMCIIEIGDGVYEVLSTHGDNRVGGRHLDRLLVDWVAEHFRSATGIDLQKDPAALCRLPAAIETARIGLSSGTEAIIRLPAVAAGCTPPADLRLTVPRSCLDELSREMLRHLGDACAHALHSARLSAKDIQGVLLVGGLARMPGMRQLATQLFPTATMHEGVATEDASVLGAAILSAVLQGRVRDVLLLDVTSMALGVRTHGDIMTPLIERNTTIPTSKKEIFTTSKDGQRGVKIRVLAGESSLGQDSLTLAVFDFKNITPAPRRSAEIEVEFMVDASGALVVTATDLSTKVSKEFPKIDIRFLPCHTGGPRSVTTPGDSDEMEVFTDEPEPVPARRCSQVEEALDLLLPVLETFDHLRATKAPATMQEVQAFQKGIAQLHEQLRGVMKLLQGDSSPDEAPADASAVHLHVLEMLRDCERNLRKAMADDGAPLRRAQIAHQVILEGLEERGVTVIRPEPRDPLDPVHHNAVAQQSVRGIPAGRVSRCLGFGFRVGTRIFRVAQVAVQPGHA